MPFTERQEEAKQRVAPKVGEKEKPKLNDYKSQEGFRMVIGTGTQKKEKKKEQNNVVIGYYNPEGLDHELASC